MESLFEDRPYPERGLKGLTGRWYGTDRDPSSSVSGLCSGKKKRTGSPGTKHKSKEEVGG